MAAKRSTIELREIADFVGEIYRWGQYARQSEWARDAGFPEPNLSKVMGGKAGIDGLNLVRLYKAAEKRATTPRPVTVVSDDEVRESAVRLLAMVRELLQRLGLDPEAADG